MCSPHHLSKLHTYANQVTRTHFRSMGGILMITWDYKEGKWLQRRKIEYNLRGLVYSSAHLELSGLQISSYTYLIVFPILVDKIYKSSLICHCKWQICLLHILKEWQQQERSPINLNHENWKLQNDKDKRTGHYRQ